MLEELKADKAGLDEREDWLELLKRSEVCNAVSEGPILCLIVLFQCKNYLYTRLTD